MRNAAGANFNFKPSPARAGSTKVTYVTDCNHLFVGFFFYFFHRLFFIFMNLVLQLSSIDMKRVRLTARTPSFRPLSADKGKTNQDVQLQLSMGRRGALRVIITRHGAPAERAGHYITEGERMMVYATGQKKARQQKPRD